MFHKMSDNLSKAMQKFCAGNHPKTEQILRLHYERGKAPSEIDKELFLEEGTAHDIIIDWWKYGWY